MYYRGSMDYSFQTLWKWFAFFVSSSEFIAESDEKKFGNVLKWKNLVSYGCRSQLGESQPSSLHVSFCAVGGFARTVSSDPRTWVMTEWFRFKREQKDSPKLLNKTPCPQEPPKRSVSSSSPACIGEEVMQDGSHREDLVPNARWLISVIVWGLNSFVVWRLGCLASLEPKWWKNSSSVNFWNFLFLWVSSAESQDGLSVKKEDWRPHDALSLVPWCLNAADDLHSAPSKTSAWSLCHVKLLKAWNVYLATSLLHHN